MRKMIRWIVSVTAIGGLLFTAAVTSANHGLASSSRIRLTEAAASPPAINIDNCPTLSRGYQGGCVSELQTELNADDNAGLPVDGIFGPLTEQAVITFQQQHSVVPADGIVGPLTKQALDSASPAPPPQAAPSATGPVSLGSCPSLSEGSQGGCVSELQTELNADDNAGLPVDGVFGPLTEQAVITFQLKNGISPALGLVGPQTKAALDGAGTQPIDPAQLPDLGGCGQMTVGSSGPCVQALQYSLMIVGMNVVQDGRYGPQTVGAVKAFQMREGITADGIAGPLTIAALDRAANSPQPDRSFDGCPQLKIGVTSPCVLRLRYELVNFDSTYQIPFDQTYGPAIAAAVRDYQSRNQLGVDGVVGQMTADLLDFQAGPQVVCIAQGGNFQADGTCGSDGTTGMGKSVWDCVQELAGKDIAEAIERSDMSAEKAGEVIPKGAFSEFMKKAGAPAEAFKCITWG